MKGRVRGPKPTGMNKLEARYAEELENRRWAGLIQRWDYEAVKLRLADGAFYTPDFRVVDREGFVEMHETKGFMREAALVRLKVANNLHPYVFKLVRWEPKQKTWLVETL